MGLLLALSAVIGDLIASVLKRLASMKDSGGSIPGIGGLFDLTDSLILAAPTGYFILFFLQSEFTKESSPSRSDRFHWRKVPFE